MVISRVDVCPDVVFVADVVATMRFIDGCRVTPSCLQLRCWIILALHAVISAAYTEEP